MSDPVDTSATKTIENSEDGVVIQPYRFRLVSPDWNRRLKQSEQTLDKALRVTSHHHLPTRE